MSHTYMQDGVGRVLLLNCDHGAAGSEGRREKEAAGAPDTGDERRKGQN